MALIDNEEAARRLARVILSDIELYQQKRIEAGDDMTGDLAEGRALFGRRVAPQLAPIFDSVLSTRRLGGGSANMPAPAMVRPKVAPVAAPPEPPASEPPAPPSPPEPSPAAADPVLATEAAVGAEMSLAETGRSVVTAEIAQSMMAEGSAPEHDTTSPDAPPVAESAAAAPPRPKLPTDDRATPVPVEDVVSRPSGAADELPPRPPVEAAPERPPEPPRDEPEPPHSPEATADEERITARGMAVFTEPEPEPIKLSPPMPPPVATPPAPMPTPPPIPAAARAVTPRPVVLAQRPPETTAEPPTKTPQPLSLPTPSPAQSPPGARIGTPGGSPRVATPFRSGAFQPLNLPPTTEAAVAAPLAAVVAEPAAAPAEDVVNLRKKTPKVVILLVVLAVIGGVMLIGRFLTRFL